MNSSSTANVHESSYVDDGAEVGNGTRVWHFCHIMSGAKIGLNCRIGQNVVVGPNVHVGDGCKIQNNVSIYEGVTLEENVFCGPSMVFTNVLTPRCAFPRNTHEDFHPTRVRANASIGANATVVCGVTIGRYALVGAGSVVTRDVPDFGVVYGNPARQWGWACECGYKLSDEFPFTVCQDCGRQYDHHDDGTLVRRSTKAA